MINSLSLSLSLSLLLCSICKLFSHQSEISIHYFCFILFLSPNVLQVFFILPVLTAIDIFLLVLVASIWCRSSAKFPPSRSVGVGHNLFLFTQHSTCLSFLFTGTPKQDWSSVSSGEFCRGTCEQRVAWRKGQSTLNSLQPCKWLVILFSVAVQSMQHQCMMISGENGSWGQSTSQEDFAETLPWYWHDWDHCECNRCRCAIVTMFLARSDNMVVCSYAVIA